jgi:DNA/RNA-binding domain of Phe-tRNA-synthetase-like protein
MLDIAPHPLLELAAFVTIFPASLAQQTSSARLMELLSTDAEAPLQSSDAIRRAVRDLLRHGGFKPTGRSKPASEYLLKAASGATLDSINLAVDACNVVSLHSGLPISVVDLDKVQPPLHIAIAEKSTSYVFNPSGQTIDIGGLLCLFDAVGPCAGPVKDSQRTKTSPATRRTLSIVWGTTALPGRAAEAAAWYQDILREHGAHLQPI